MYFNQHLFHIPVMGTGHSVDSPIRVAHLGINSVISVTDDLLLEKIRKHYCKEFNFPWKGIPRTAPDGRARRVSAYLELVAEIVRSKFENLKSLPLFEGSEKDRYFRLLPDESPLRQAYDYAAKTRDAVLRSELVQNLTEKMRPGRIEVNIMAKVDALRTDGNDMPLSPEFSDASSALRGFASSSLDASLVLSAGFNPRLYSYLSEFDDFFRDLTGRIKKRIVLKVSDFRSALIQGKFLAKKGLEVSEFRIESGLNCGGHAFASDGELLPVLLAEFRRKREELAATFQPMIRAWYESAGKEFVEPDGGAAAPALTVQGGIGTSGETDRLLHEYGMESTGWGSPFLLVPEATCVDRETTELLEQAGEKDLYLSNVSPLGVPFNNIRGSGSESYRKRQIERDKPGSKCPKGYLVSNTEFTDEPICTASMQYQLLKIDQIRESEGADHEKEGAIDEVLEKDCLCEHLGTGALIRLGILKPSYGRQTICPGPNIAWFDRSFSLEEMVDHIYGRGPSLVPEERPHMFANELVMYVDYLEEMIRNSAADGRRKVEKFASNLEKGMEECLRIAQSKRYGDENLDSLEKTVRRQRERLESLMEPVA